jgi:hypothetical protein
VGCQQVSQHDKIKDMQNKEHNEKMQIKSSITSVTFHFHFLFFFLHHHPRATSHPVVRGTLRGQRVQATLQVTMTRGRWSWCGVGFVGTGSASGGVGLVGDVFWNPILDLGPVVQVGQLLGLRGVPHGVVV